MLLLLSTQTYTGSDVPQPKFSGSVFPEEWEPGTNNPCLSQKQRLLMPSSILLQEQSGLLFPLISERKMSSNQVRILTCRGQILQKQLSAHLASDRRRLNHTPRIQNDLHRLWASVSPQTCWIPALKGGCWAALSNCTYSTTFYTSRKKIPKTVIAIQQCIFIYKNTNVTHG